MFVTGTWVYNISVLLLVLLNIQLLKPYFARKSCFDSYLYSSMDNHLQVCNITNDYECGLGIAYIANYNVETHIPFIKIVQIIFRVS